MFNEEKYQKEIREYQNDEIYEYLLNHAKNPYNFPQLKEMFNKHANLVNLQNSKGKYLLSNLADEYINLSFANGDDFIIRNYEKLIELIYKNPNFEISEYETNQIQLSVQSSILRVNSIDSYDEETKKRVKFNLNELVGNINDAKKTADQLAYKYDIEIGFDQTILDEIDEYLTVDNELYKDIRDEYIITIDNEDTHLYDDAIGLEILENGNYKLRVCITDAAKFAPLKSKINHEAFRRAEKVYLNKYHFGNQMLPEKLSNEHCSLQAGKNRYVVSFNYEFTSKLDLVDFHAERAIVNVAKNMSYKEATSHLIKPKDETESTMINNLLVFANKLRKSDNFRYIREKEYTKDLKVKEGSIDTVNSIIQLLSTLTNHFVGNYFSDKNLLIIYTTSQATKTPPMLRDPKVKTSEAIEKVVKDVEPGYGPANYSIRRIGYHSANLKNYAPVTSPGRKYADLFNLEMVKHFMIDKIPYDGDRNQDKRYITHICKALNKRISENKKYVEDSYNYKANPLKEEVKNRVIKDKQNKNRKDKNSK